MKTTPLAIAIALSCSAHAVSAQTQTNPTQQPENDDIERIVVVSSRVAMPIREVATSVSVITKQDIEARGYTNIADVLEVLPAINTTNSGGLGTQSSLRIRGEEGFRTQIRIDGVEISDPTGVQIGPLVEHIQSANVDRVEILRGSQGLLYGADAGGVINIQSAIYQVPLQGRISTEYGRFNTTNITGDIGGKTDKLDYYLAVSEFDTNGFNSRIDDDTADDDGYENTTAHLRLAYQVNEQLSLGLVGRTNNGEGEFDACFDQAFNGSNDCQNEFSQDNLRLSASYATARSHHELAFSKTFIERDFLTENVSTFLTEGTLERLEYLANTQFSKNSRIVYGFDWKQESITSDNVSRNNRGYHIEYQASPLDNTYLTAGARLDDNDDFGTHVSYRLGGAYLIPTYVGEVKLRSSVGTGFRAPSLSELIFNRGPFAFPPASNVELSEETTFGYEFGVQYLAETGSSIELVYFDQEIEDAIFFDLVNFSGNLQDDGTTDSNGIEIIGKYVVSDSVYFTGNFTYNDTTRADGSQRLRRPRRLANLGVNFRSNNITLNANVRFVGGFVDIGDISLDDYTVIDLSASYAINSALEVYSRLENALDEDYQDIVQFNTSGAAAHVGVRYSF